MECRAARQRGEVSITAHRAKDVSIHRAARAFLFLDRSIVRFASPRDQFGNRMSAGVSRADKATGSQVQRWVVLHKVGQSDEGTVHSFLVLSRVPVSGVVEVVVAKCAEGISVRYLANAGNRDEVERLVGVLRLFTELPDVVVRPRLRAADDHVDKSLPRKIQVYLDAATCRQLGVKGRQRHIPAAVSVGFAVGRARTCGRVRGPPAADEFIRAAV